jgi:hypothetical protein
MRRTVPQPGEGDQNQPTASRSLTETPAHGEDYPRATLSVPEAIASAHRRAWERLAVEVTATGPRVIEAGGRHADRICLAVGADPEHLVAMLEHAREAVRRAGREGAVSFGAVINCAVDADAGVARDAIRGTAATVARFSAFQDSDLSHLPAPLRTAATYIREHYDMRQHTQATAEHTHGIDDTFVDWFGVAGPVERARARFLELAATGLAFVRVIPGSTGGSADVTRATLAALGGDIAAAVRGAS